MVLLACLVLWSVLLSSRWVRAALPGEALPAVFIAGLTMAVLLAALYWLGLLSLLARDAALPVPDAVGGLLILLSGGIVAPIWGAWLGLRLPRTV